MQQNQDPKFANLARTAEHFHAELARINSELDRIIARARTGSPVARDLHQLSARATELSSMISRATSFMHAYDTERGQSRGDGSAVAAPRITPTRRSAP